MATNKERQREERSEEDLRTLVQETRWVRKLLTLQALASGYKQKHIAAALGVSGATMSRMMPKGLPTFKSASAVED